MKINKKFLTLLLLVGATLFFFNQPASARTVTVGVEGGSDEQIWRHIAQSPQAKKAHVKIKIKEITDSLQLNKATYEKVVDYNAFQSYGYLEAYNQDNRNNQLIAVGTTYLEPMGLYSKKYHSLKKLPANSKIAIPQDPANLTRGLKLLNTAGLISVKHPKSNKITLTDIQKNPKHFKFYQIDGATGPRVLKDVAAALIANTVAQEGGLNVFHDTITREKLNQTTKKNVNVLVGNRTSAKYPEAKKLIKLYHNAAIQRYIKSSFHNTKIAVHKPVSSLK